MCLVCLLLCNEDGSSPVSAITERRDMGLYEVPLFVSLLDFGIVLLCYSLLYYVSLLCRRNNDQKRVYRIKHRIKQCVTFIQYFLN